MVNISEFENSQKFYTLTRYPDIFKNTYWGSHRDVTDDIYDIAINRNNFIEEFNIKKVTSLTSRLKNTTKINKKYFLDKLNTFGLNCKVLDMDHLERYKTEDNKHIFVCSPYHSRIDEGFIKLGWINYNKLYSSGATTYILILDREKLENV